MARLVLTSIIKIRVVRLPVKSYLVNAFTWEDYKIKLEFPRERWIMDTPIVLATYLTAYNAFR